jgi:exosortase A
MSQGITETRIISERRDDPVSSEWLLAGLVTIISCAVVIGLFSPTFRTLVDAWASSRTFAHGFLILPVTLYLIWCYRDRVQGLVPAPRLQSLVLLAALAGGWLIGNLKDSSLLQQVASIAMIPGVVLATLGTAVFRAILFPLGFLFFMLPVGTVLEPWLQDFTTAFIAEGLHFAGIPVHREGYFLTIPSGVWEVAPDCAGLRYVLPGLALGYMFTAVAYRHWSRRLGFLVFCVAVLILANGVRAYGIILGDHFGIAHGADHRLFSYSVYGITIPVLFWLGLKWKESTRIEPWAPRTSVRDNKAFSFQATLFAALGSVVLLALAPLSAWLFGGPGGSP